LLSLVFRIEQMVWVCSVVALLVTGLLLALVLTLSARLRASEMLTMFRLGCSRLTIGWMQVSELLLLLIAAGTIAMIGSWLTLAFASDSLRQLLF
jgi:predicted lysophospholipase L1 biosynthesis ABC-type transport system permease subunit